MTKQINRWFLLVLMALIGAGNVFAATPSNAPAWVLNPEKAGFQSAVGFAPVQDWGGHAAQYRVAEMKARQELAQIIQTKVEAETSSRTESRGGQSNQTDETQMRISSRVGLNLENAQVLEEWTDPKTGILYLWLATPNQ